jgi:hypothetical protein
MKTKMKTAKSSTTKKVTTKKKATPKTTTVSKYAKGGKSMAKKKPMTKKYEVGGMADDSCMEEYIGADGKRRKRRKSGCNQAKAKRINARRRFWNSDTGKNLKKAGAAVGAGAAAAGAYAKNLFGSKDAIQGLMNKN